jgi:hypothetical protein
MYSEVETDWKKETVVGRKYYLGIRPQEARKIIKILNEDG